MIKRVSSLALFVLLLCISCSSSETPKDQPTDAVDSGGATTQAGTVRHGYILAAGPKLTDTIVGGSSKELLSLNDGSVLMDPALSPDGKRIAFIRQEPVKNLPGGKIDFGADLYVINRDGSGMKEIVRHGDLAEYVRTPSWLNADELLFSVRGRDASGTGDYRIEKLDLRSGQRTRVASTAVDPSVGPDRTRMTYVTVETSSTQEGIVLSAVDGSGGRAILPSSPVLTLVGATMLSPDQAKIAFAAGDLAGAEAAPPRSSMAHPFFQDVWTINADGSGLHRVVEVAERSLSLSWSPDGLWLYAMGATAFRRIDPATGAITILGDGADQGGVYVYEVN